MKEISYMVSVISAVNEDAKGQTPAYERVC